MNKETVEKILRETKRGYDLVAEKFAETRKHFWRDLEFIKGYVKDGDKVLDYGCGNGRLLDLIRDKNIEYRGVDISQELIDTASQKYGDGGRIFQKISGSDTLPFPDSFFNVIYSIAVFHHIPSKELRLKTASELYRVLKPGGYIVVSVWNLWQRKYTINIVRNWVNKFIGKSDLDWNDCYIPFEDNDKNVFWRYHHAFRKNELRKLFFETGFKTEKCGIIANKNIIFVGEK